MQATKKTKNIFMVITVLEILVLVYAVVCLFMKQNGIGITNTVKFFATIDISGMLLIIIFSFACLNHFIKNQKYLLIMVIADFFGMFFSIFQMLYEGMPEFAEWNAVVSSGMLICNSVITISVYLFILDTVANINENVKKLTLFVKIGFLISVVLRLLNIWLGFYVFIDEEGRAQSTAFFPITYIYIVIIFIICCTMVIASKISVRSKVITVLMLAIPVIAGIPCQLLFNFSCDYALVSITSIVLYSVFFIEQQYYEYQRKKIFGSFLPQNKADFIIDDNENDLSEGKRIFSSIIEIVFDKFHESVKGMDAKQKIQVFNSVMDVLVPIAEKNNGIVLHYNHDGVGFMFGAPNGDMDHADKAVRTAIDIIKCLEKYNAENEANNMPQMHAKIGISTSTALFACLRIKDQLYYTAVSTLSDDCRKIAQFEAKPGTIVATRNTIDALTRPVLIELIDQFKTQDMLRAVNVYEIKP